MRYHSAVQSAAAVPQSALAPPPAAATKLLPLSPAMSERNWRKRSWYVRATFRPSRSAATAAAANGQPGAGHGEHEAQMWGAWGSCRATVQRGREICQLLLPATSPATSKAPFVQGHPARAMPRTRNARLRRGRAGPHPRFPRAASPRCSVPAGAWASAWRFGSPAGAAHTGCGGWRHAQLAPCPCSCRHVVSRSHRFDQHQLRRQPRPIPVPAIGQLSTVRKQCMPAHTPAPP